MAQSDQVVQNATFPTVRSDINDNLAALFSQSSGNSAPTTTVAYQPWIDTGSSPALWKIRNAANTGWITVGSIDASTFAPGGITPIANGGTGQITASGAINALVPSQAGNSGKALVTNGTLVSWSIVAAGASVQVFTSSGTYTPTSSKTTFLVFGTGGGGGGAYSTGGTVSGGGGGGGGGGGTAVRLYTTTEMGLNATVTIGSAGALGDGGSLNGGNGGSTSFTPSGTGLAITGAGGSGGLYGASNSGSGGNGGGATNSMLDINGQKGNIGESSAASSSSGASGGSSFWGGGRGAGGAGGSAIKTGSGTSFANGYAGIAGAVFILEW